MHHTEQRCALSTKRLRQAESGSIEMRVVRGALAKLGKFRRVRCGEHAARCCTAAMLMLAFSRDAEPHVRWKARQSRGLTSPRLRGEVDEKQGSRTGVVRIW